MPDDLFEQTVSRTDRMGDLRTNSLLVMEALRCVSFLSFNSTCTDQLHILVHANFILLFMIAVFVRVCVLFSSFTFNPSLSLWISLRRLLFP